METKSHSKWSDTAEVKLKSKVVFVYLFFMAFSQISFAVDCDFFTKNIEGRIVSRNLIFDAETKEVLDRHSKIKFDFKLVGTQVEVGHFRFDFGIIITDLNDENLYEKVLVRPITKFSIGPIKLEGNEFLFGSCSEKFELQNNPVRVADTGSFR
jgi:hypothetical protein